MKLSIKQAAKALRRSKKNVKELMRKREIPFRRRNGVVEFESREIEIMKLEFKGDVTLTEALDRLHRKDIE